MRPCIVAMLSDQLGCTCLAVDSLLERVWGEGRPQGEDEGSRGGAKGAWGRWSGRPYSRQAAIRLCASSLRGSREQNNS